MYSKKHIAFMDLRSDTNYTEMTICMRANFRSFFPNAWNWLFQMGSGMGGYDYEWYFVIFEPFHSMRDLEKQVFVSSLRMFETDPK